MSAVGLQGQRAAESNIGFNIVLNIGSKIGFNIGVSIGFNIASNIGFNIENIGSSFESNTVLNPTLDPILDSGARWRCKPKADIMSAEGRLKGRLGMEPPGIYEKHI